MMYSILKLINREIQSIMAIRSSDQVQKLCSLIVQHNLLSPVDISIAYQTYLMMKIQACQCQYVLDAANGRLVLQERDDNAHEPQEWSSLDMPAPAATCQWVPFTSEKVALFDPAGAYKGVFDRSRPEIVPSKNGGYIWASKQPFRTSLLLNPLLPLEQVERGPYDFYFPEDQDNGVFLTDRAAGTLMMTDLTLNVPKARLKLREPGNKKALCLAYSPQNRTCYVTDHQTSDLIVIQPGEQKIERFSTPFGCLGNLVLDSLNKQILAILAAPEQEAAILIFSQEDFSHQGTILLPGKRFSTLDDPCDLMGLSPDGKSLLVMSYSDEPALGTPLISQINLKTHQLVKTHTLNEEEKPIAFAFQFQEPQQQDVPDFDDFLNDKGIAPRPQIIGLVRQILTLEEDKKKPLYDQDVEAAMSHIQENFSVQEVQEVSELSQQAVDSLANERFFEWQGRQDMNAEEKKVLVEHLGQLKADEKVSRTNGIFVLNWLKGLG